MPASSLVSKPTSTLGSDCRGSFRSTASSVAGFNLAAHPAAFAIEVSFGEAVDIILVYSAGGNAAPTPFHSLCCFAFHCKACVAEWSHSAIFQAQSCLRGANVISSRHALGYLADSSGSGGRCTVARAHPPKTAARQTPSGTAGTHFALSFDDRISMDCCRNRRLAWLGSWVHKHGIGFRYWS